MRPFLFFIGESKCLKIRNYSARYLLLDLDYTNIPFRQIIPKGQREVVQRALRFGAGWLPLSFHSPL